MSAQTIGEQINERVNLLIEEHETCDELKGKGKFKYSGKEWVKHVLSVEKYKLERVEEKYNEWLENIQEVSKNE